MVRVPRLRRSTHRLHCHAVHDSGGDGDCDRGVPVMVPVEHPKDYDLARASGESVDWWRHVHGEALEDMRHALARSGHIVPDESADVVRMFCDVRPDWR